MPDAPAPRYDSHGSIVARWGCSAAYDPTSDTIVVSWWQAEGSYTKAKSQSEVFTPMDVEDVAALLQRSVRILGARRLF